MRHILLVLVLLLCVLSIPRAQSLPAWTAHTTFTNLVEGLEAAVADPGTGAFVPLTSLEQQVYGIGIQQLLNGDPLAARATLNTLGLEVYTFINDAKTTSFYVVHELAAVGAPGHKGWSPTMVNRQPRRNVAFIAPHVKFDTYSVRGMTQAAISLQPRLVTIGGTHRCANTEASSCSGTTGACPGYSAYRISDPIHVTTSGIFALYEHVATNAEIAKVVEFHTQVSGQPAAVQLSNGTTQPYIPGDFTKIVRDALDAQSDFTVLSCNKVGDPAGTFCSGTNVGGRLLNGVRPAADTCTTNATAASGRWLHIEAYSSVWNSSTQRGHIIAALAEALPQDMPGSD